MPEFKLFTRLIKTENNQFTDVDPISNNNLHQQDDDDFIHCPKGWHMLSNKELIEQVRSEVSEEAFQEFQLYMASVREDMLTERIQEQEEMENYGY